MVAAGPHSGQSRFAWSPCTPRQHADVIVRMGTEGDVEACARLVPAIGAD